MMRTNSAAVQSTFRKDRPAVILSAAKDLMAIATGILGFG
jgi:hypothetical protein